MNKHKIYPLMTSVTTLSLSLRRIFRTPCSPLRRVHSVVTFRRNSIM